MKWAMALNLGNRIQLDHLKQGSGVYIQKRKCNELYGLGSCNFTRSFTSIVQLDSIWGWKVVTFSA